MSECRVWSAETCRHDVLVPHIVEPIRENPGGAPVSRDDVFVHLDRSKEARAYLGKG